MAKKEKVPLYDELVKSPEFSELDYEDKKDFHLGRKEELGAEKDEMQEQIALKDKISKNNNTNKEEEVPLYDEVIKSPEFSDLTDDKEKFDKVTPRKVDLGPEPEESQEKILVDE